MKPLLFVLILFLNSPLIASDPIAVERHVQTTIAAWMDSLEWKDLTSQWLFVGDSESHTIVMEYHLIDADSATVGIEVAMSTNPQFWIPADPVVPKVKLTATNPGRRIIIRSPTLWWGNSLMEDTPIYEGQVLSYTTIYLFRAARAIRLRSTQPLKGYLYRQAEYFEVHGIYSLPWTQ